MAAKYLFSLCISLIILCTSNPDLGTLKQLIVVSRHGIRGPANRLPGRKCQLQQLDAQISSVGHFQNYKLGDALKTTYNPATSSSDSKTYKLGDYDRKRHIFYGTDEDKNLMSGNTVAQGLYPDYFVSYQKDTYSELKLVRPSIPIHAAPDHVLNYETTCKTKLDSFIPPICRDSAEGKKLTKKYKDCFASIRQTAGLPQNVTIVFPNVPLLAEQIILSTGHLKYLDSTNTKSPLHSVSTLPEGYGAAEINNCLYPANSYCTFKDDDGNVIKDANGNEVREYWNDLVVNLATLRQQMMSDAKHVELAQLRNTPFIHYAINHMKTYIQKHTDTSLDWKTFIFHLASNGNVQYLLQLFGQPTPGRIPFGSFVFFELHRISGNDNSQSIDDYRVKVGYRILSNTTFEVDPYPADDYRCPENDKVCTHFFLNKGEVWWTLDEILALVMDMDTWRSECGIQDAQYYSEELRSTQSTLASTDDDKNKYQTLFIVVLIVLLVLLVIAIIIIILQCFGCCCCGASSNSSSSYDSSKEEEMDDQQAV